MYRLLACLLFALILGACASWRASPVAPERLIAEEQPTRVRITLADGTGMVLRNPEAEADSVRGRVLTASGAMRVTTIALAEITSVEISESTGVWYVEAGRTSLHENTPTTGALGLGTRGPVRLSGVAALGGYAALESRLEVHAAPEYVLSPFFGLQGGLFWEDEYGGWVGGALVGFVLRPSPSFGVRLLARASMHGGERGPDFLGVGLQMGGP